MLFLHSFPAHKAQLFSRFLLLLPVMVRQYTEDLEKHPANSLSYLILNQFPISKSMPLCLKIGL